MDTRTIWDIMNDTYPGWSYRKTYYGIPDGFELVEKKSHKKERLEKEKERLESRIEYFKNSMVEEDEKLKDVKKELKELEKD